MKKNKQNQAEESDSIEVTAPSQPLRKRKKKIKKAPIIIVVIIILIIIIRFVACGNTASVAYVTTTAPIWGDVEESISTSGTVDSENKKTYFAQVSGVLGEVTVEAGDVVSAGDKLIGYDQEQLETALRQASLQQTVSNSTYQSVLSGNSDNQSKLSEANTNLTVLNQQIADYEAYLKVLQEKLSSNQRETSSSLAAESYTLSARSTALQQEIAQLEGQESSEEYIRKAQELQEVSVAISRNAYLQQIAGSSDYQVDMQKEIEEVQERLADCKEYKMEMETQKTSSENSVLDSYQKTQYFANQEISDLTYQKAEEDYYTAKQGITAEFDGIVTSLSAQEGATIIGGAQLLTLADTNNIKVTFSASKYDLEKLEIGQKAEVTIFDNIYEGEISKINRMATANVSGTPMVDVEIHLTSPDAKIILGMDAKIEILTNKSENVLLIPVEAVNADRDGDFLYVAENGVVVRKPVVSGISSDTYIEIKEGITESDRVILTSYTDLTEGMAVVAMSAE